MRTTKVCRDPNHDGERELPLSHYPRRHTTPDGLAPICKVCSRRKVKAAAEKGNGRPRYTNRIVQLLNTMRIPSFAGGAKIGHPYVDILSWGCVRIELKYSSDMGSNGLPEFHWTFNKRQTTHDVCDVVILTGIAKNGTEYIFVMPYLSAQQLLNDAANRGKGGAIQCVIGSEHHNAKIWPLLSEWRNRFDVIETARLKYT